MKIEIDIPEQLIKDIKMVVDIDDDEKAINEALTFALYNY